VQQAQPWRSQMDKIEQDLSTFLLSQAWKDSLGFKHAMQRSNFIFILVKRLLQL
jgi:hypothetical protein